MLHRASKLVDMMNVKEKLRFLKHPVKVLRPARSADRNKDLLKAYAERRKQGGF